MVNLLESRRRILLATPHLESPTPANPLTFKSNMSTKLKEGKVYFTPVQEGTGDPSPDNVRPILGWDGITVTKCGKNLLNPNDPDYGNYTIGPTGKKITSSRDRITSGFIPCGEDISLVTHSTKIIISYVFSFVTISAWDKNKQFISRAFANNTATLQFTTPTNTCYIRYSEQFNGKANPTPSYFSTYQRQLEISSTPTEYEPYTETKIAIPFPQTIYGGYVDLVNGEVVEEYEGVDLSTVGFSQYSKSNHCWSSAIPRMATGNRLTANDIFCDSYKSYDRESILSSGHNLGIWGYNTSQRRIIIRNDAYIGEDGKYDTDAFNESLKDKYLYYPLATPIHHTIDPQVIRPLKGVNNIWSDANGNIEIKFWKH